MADGRRSELMAAVRNGEQFATETGLPLSELRELKSPTWYAHACSYALMKWPHIAAKHRANIAESLATVTALSAKLDSKKTAENTDGRKRTAFNNALRYAVERDLLTGNPLSRIDWDPPATNDEVDFPYVPNPAQTQALLGAVRDQGKRGEHLHSFFGCMYYAALRPSEVAQLSKRDCQLPASGWGEFI
ncbi:hypothetical protein ACWCO0_01095 [Streptomyces tubercidicus]